MKELIQKIRLEFDIDVIEIKKLNGYDNINYLVSSNHQNYIFKTYLFDESTLDLVEAENMILLELLKTHSSKNSYPKPIAFKDGSYIKILEISNQKLICRMLSFLEGDFIATIPPSKDLYKSLGTFLAKLDLNLKHIKNYVIQSRQWEWDIQYLNLNKKYIHDIDDTRNRNVVTYFFQQFNEIVTPVLPTLRKQLIHNDANEWNVLTTSNKVSAIIDFGDVAYAPLINELAVALTYTSYDKEDPLEWMIPTLEAYHSIINLEEKEVAILYYLIAARLCISVCNSAHARKKNPKNKYATTSEKSAFKMLHKWLAINPIFAENTFRKAIGLSKKKVDPINKVIEKRHQHISPIFSISYKSPIHFNKAAFQYMYDTYGNTFLDAYNNIPHVGHSHPKVVEAGQKQMAKLNTNTRYLYDQLSAYAEKLLSKFPKKLSKVFFVNSGSAASDLALRMVTAHTGTNTTMVMEHGYHGNTQSAINVSDYKFNNPKGIGKKDHIIKTAIPDTYRGKFKKNDGTAGTQYAREVIDLIKNSNRKIGTFISEPIVGCGGQIPLAKGYLKEIYPAIREQGGVCISDEVQTGFGRLGDYFWGYEMQEVIPDMVILGKPIANGHPMGAVVCTSEIAASFSKGVEFFSSFGGNPVSCEIALAVLEVIESEKLQENAKMVGDYYKSLLNQLKNDFSCIGDVRGSGLFLGIDIIKEQNLEPNTELAQHIKNKLREEHILISTDGPFDNVLKSKPPLCFTKDNAEQVVQNIHKILKNY